MDRMKIIISALAGAAATFFSQYGIIIGAVLGAVAIDCITGLVKAKATQQGWDSKKANKGFWKKIALLVALAFGMLLDLLSPTILSQIGVTIPFNLPFALIIGCYITLNECISICENLYTINPGIMPKWIVKLLKVAKKDIDDSVNTDQKINKNKK